MLDVHQMDEIRAFINSVKGRAFAAEMDPRAKPGAPAGAGVRANAPAPAAVEWRYAKTMEFSLPFPTEESCTPPCDWEAGERYPRTRSLS